MHWGTLFSLSLCESAHTHQQVPVWDWKARWSCGACVLVRWNTATLWLSFILTLFPLWTNTVKPKMFVWADSGMVVRCFCVVCVLSLWYCWLLIGWSWRQQACMPPGYKNLLCSGSLNSPSAVAPPCVKLEFWFYILCKNILCLCHSQLLFPKLH